MTGSLVRARSDLLPGPVGQGDELAQTVMLVPQAGDGQGGHGEGAHGDGGDRVASDVRVEVGRLALEGEEQHRHEDRQAEGEEAAAPLGGPAHGVLGGHHAEGEDDEDPERDAGGGRPEPSRGGRARSPPPARGKATSRPGTTVVGATTTARTATVAAMAARGEHRSPLGRAAGGR